MALMSKRYDFGKNWASFIETSFSADRRNIAKQQLLDFLKKEDLRNLSFLDIGSGSGLHSLAASDAGAARIHSFDYDEMSVQTTARLKAFAGAPPNWTVEKGDVLNPDYLKNLGLWDIVYSWGVLHHTGAMWNAIDNAAGRVAPNGLIFLALYSSNVASPSTEFWLDVKKRYNLADERAKRRMELWYLWHFGLGRNPLRLPALIKQIWQKKKQRGMSYMTDVRDWLGGWPMEYADDQEIIDVMKKKHGFALIKISTGEACTEFLFARTDDPSKATV
jgi:SAM-dependent methyltransferase